MWQLSQFRRRRHLQRPSLRTCSFKLVNHRRNRPTYIYKLHKTLHKNVLFFKSLVPKPEHLQSCSKTTLNNRLYWIESREYFRAVGIESKKKMFCFFTLLSSLLALSGQFKVNFFFNFLILCKKRLKKIP